MKTQQSIEAARNASLKKAIRICSSLAAEMAVMGATHDTAVHMPSIRRQLATLEQRVHEYNAYNNSLSTE